MPNKPRTWVCEHKRNQRRVIQVLVCKDCGACHTKERGRFSDIIKRIAMDMKKTAKKGPDFELEEEK